MGCSASSPETSNPAKEGQAENGQAKGLGEATAVAPTGNGAVADPAAASNNATTNRPVIKASSDGAAATVSSEEKDKVGALPRLGPAGADRQVSGEVEDSLKKFAKRNRPPKGAARFKTSGGITAPERSGSGAPSSSSEEPKTNSVNVAGDLAKFDIFDNLDEDRLKEFEEMFKKAKENSNYEEHKRKSKKHDPNKFTTATGSVTVNEEGLSMLS